MADLLFDFDNPADAKRSLKRVAQAMFRAGQPVVSSDFDQKVRRTAGVSYRQALLTLASGQTVALMTKLTGDVYRVLLNGAVLPIKNQDGLKAIAEIAAAAERNQAKFQKAQARKLVELPKSIRTAAPRMEQALQARVVELDAHIAARTAERDALRAELGEQALDSIGEAVALSARIIGGEALDGADLSGALATLQTALDVVETNAPINEADGNVEQAALERANAASFREAIGILEGSALDGVGQPPGADELSGAALEVLAQIAEGPVEDGDVISKAARDELVDAGLIDRYTDAGDNVVNDAGLARLSAQGAPLDSEASLPDEDDDQAVSHEGQESLFED